MTAKPEFLDLLERAVSAAREQFPDAEFYEADGSNPDQPTPNVHDIGMWRFVFRVEEGTVFVKTAKPWGDLDQPELVPHPWLEDRVIPQPVPMDITAADKLLKEQGHYAGPYTNVTLRWPLFPGVTEPSYFFKTVGLGFISVGVYSHQVRHVS
ncbi:hypothetical protein [Streptomyces roseochromogenus]|uniref:Uncharacterized protein n=1 Tax=Streptomyces roseochromogenus subsp. oscitans DS 12.976 TaxID=1352936 RepID=V6L114_STRRC|nr:hypothetical protein [Streptomyces roseochromogenus]EST34914.1 hypothetical protein M878_08600 [Streptomyces roseochromogenus subsp. oscitans DS 12.976]